MTEDATPSAAPTAGVVLAGGRSSRFRSREKALADLAGRPLLGRALEGVAPAVAGVVANCRREQVGRFTPVLAAAPASVAVAPDPVPDRGPAAGMAAALAGVCAPTVAIVACDRPLVEGDLFLELLDRLGDAEAVVPRVDDHLQVAQAVYRTGPAREAAVAAVERGDGSLHDVVAALDATVVPERAVETWVERGAFVDVNEPDDLDCARCALSSRRG